MTRLQSEIVISTEKNQDEGELILLRFSSRNVVTGKFESTLTILGDEDDLMTLVNRLKNRIEQAFRSN